MSKNFYDDGFADDDPTDELPILTDVYADSDEGEAAATRESSADVEDTGSFAVVTSNEIPVLAERDERAVELEQGIADRDARLASLEAELGNLEQRWRATSAELTTARAELEERAIEATAHRQAIDEARGELDAREKRLAELTAALETAQAASAAFEDNARALEQQIVKLETVQAQSAARTASEDESVTVAKLREELAALAQHIDNRNAIWNTQAAEAAEHANRIRELEIELTQRVTAQKDAEQLAELEAERARDFRERLTAALAALEVAQSRDTDLPTTETPEIRKIPAAPDRAPERAPDRLRMELERAVALQAGAADDSEGLRRLEELELAIRDLERDMDAVVAEPPGTAVEARPAELICLTGDESQIFSLDAPEIVIGRSSHCGIRISTHYVSREHARLETIHGRCFIEDLGSRNGVFVNSVRIDRQDLNDDDLITIGDTQFQFRAGRSYA